MMAQYVVSDMGGVRLPIEADSAEDAAREYVSGGNYDDGEMQTLLISVTVWQGSEPDEESERSTITVAVDPPEPRCAGGAHEWQSPQRIVGGIESAPGVWANDGGLWIQDVCMLCGCGRLTDTWAQDDCGRYGHRTVKYEPGKYAREIAAE